VEERRILLAVTGGIAAYKTPELVRALRRAGHAVRCAMTRAAAEFVSPLALQTVSGHAVRSALFDAAEEGQIDHIALADWAELVIVAPATAHSLARFAAGLADDLVSTVVLATRAPLLLAPAMNVNMWRHPATAHNVAVLSERGAHWVGPDAGELACGWEGEGRMSDPARIAERANELLGPRDFAGVRVLVTAGGTREPIDSVRYVGNRSSGRMGFAVAEEAAARGADVTVIAANVSLPRADGVRYEDVETAAQLEEAARRHFPDADVLVMAAAVADFRPPAAEGTKLSKTGRDALELRLEPTTDVLAALSAERRPGQTLVGFAAEHGPEGVERARGKLERKGLDAVVVNDISREDIGFDSGDNEVTIVTAAGERPLAKAPKAEIARAIVDLVEEVRHERRPA